MRVVVAKSAGFCQGVRRAIRTAERLAAETRPVFTDGPLIHNAHETARLAALGVRTLSPGATPPPGSVLMVRAHGVSPRRMAALEALPGVEICDATCPFVRSIQEVCRAESASGRFVVILGDPGHAEVAGLSGCAEGRGAVVTGPGDLEALPDPGLPVSLVSQSTQDESLFDAVRAAALARWPDARAINTICGATRTRQAELAKLAAECDAIVVVGSPQSANTRRLAEIAGRMRPVFFAESAASLDPAAFAGFRTVGVAAGASTPDADIAGVRDLLENAIGANPRQGAEQP